MTKDFSYLDTKYSNKRYYGIMIIAFFSTITILYTITTIQNPTVFVVLFMLFCMGMIVLIHWLGGVKPKDILSYQGWCQDEFKKLKKEKKK